MIVRTELKSKAELIKYISTCQPKVVTVFENVTGKELDEIFRKKSIEHRGSHTVLIISK